MCNKKWLKYETMEYECIIKHKLESWYTQRCYLYIIKWKKPVYKTAKIIIPFLVFENWWSSIENQVMFLLSCLLIQIF